jgi:hypothetical protein
MATPKTKHFPLKEPDARNLFFYVIQENYLWATAMSGATVCVDWGDHGLKQHALFILPSS